MKDKPLTLNDSQTQKGEMMKKFTLGLVLSVLSLAAHAYQFDFTGRVTYSDGSLSGVTVGTLMQGSFSAEGPKNAYAIHGLDVLASYSFASGQVSAQIGGHTVSAKSPSVRIFDDFGGNVEDGFSMSSGYPLVVDGVTYSSGAFGFNLTTKPGNTGVIHGLGLPTQIDVSQFDGHSSLTYGYMQRNGAAGGTILGFQVLSVRVAAVPEASAAALAIVGLLGVAACARRSRA